jgi:hypothetical protein
VEKSEEDEANKCTNLSEDFIGCQDWKEAGRKLSIGFLLKCIVIQTIIINELNFVIRLNFEQILGIYLIHSNNWVHALAKFVEALRYNLEGRLFESR